MKRASFFIFGLMVSLVASRAAEKTAAPSPSEWREYLGGPDRNHYSPLEQINPRNVSRLKVAWEYHTGDSGQMQCNPIVVDGRLYAPTASAEIFCLDAATGKQLWRYAEGVNVPNRTIRGVTYWKDGDDERILFALDSSLCALDARTGKLIAGFGVNGKTSLKLGLGTTVQQKWVVSTTPGTIFGDLIIMPLRVDETEDAAPGSIQAFNVRTGALAWVFHTIPLPGEFGYGTWPKDAHLNTAVGAANCWAGMSVDRERGILFVPTGSASPDFWGGNRKGQNLFANCLLALDARTGKRLWHFQFVHHDIWDRDLPAPPNLVTIHRNGRKIDAVAQVTKAGYVYVFDRVTGEPVFPIPEVQAPRSATPGEQTWPTQPVPLQPAPFARQSLSERDLNPYSENRDALLAFFRTCRLGAFVPLDPDHPTLLLPGFDGGAEWGGAAADPQGVLYINANNVAWVTQLIAKVKPETLATFSPGHRAFATFCAGCHGVEKKGNATSGYPSLVDIGQRRSRSEILSIIEHGRGMMPGFVWLAKDDRAALSDYLAGTEKASGAATPLAPEKRDFTPYGLDGYVKFLDQQGYPAISPPWGSLSAIDLNTGEYLWKVTLGEYKELTARGIPPTGSESYGGPIVTESGLLFIAATKDGMFRAFDRRTGVRLWETELPAPGFATPSTYEVGGKQFIVVACGGTKLDTKSGDSFVAFALP